MIQFSGNLCPESIPKVNQYFHKNQGEGKGGGYLRRFCKLSQMIISYFEPRYFKDDLFEYVKST